MEEEEEEEEGEEEEEEDSTHHIVISSWVVLKLKFWTEATATHNKLSSTHGLVLRLFERPVRCRNTEGSRTDFVELQIDWR